MNDSKAQNSSGLNFRDILLYTSFALISFCLYGLYQARERLYLEPELAAERRWAATNSEVTNFLDDVNEIKVEFKELKTSNIDLWNKFKELQGATATLSHFVDSNSIIEWNKKFAVLEAKWSGYQNSFDKILNQDGTLTALEQKFMSRTETENLLSGLNEKYWALEEKFNALKKEKEPQQESFLNKVSEVFKNKLERVE